MKLNMIRPVSAKQEAVKEKKDFKLRWEKRISAHGNKYFICGNWGIFQKKEGYCIRYAGNCRFTIDGIATLSKAKKMCLFLSSEAAMMDVIIKKSKDKYL